MTPHVPLSARIEQYVAERRRLGFQMRKVGSALGRFARYVDDCGHQGPLTAELMAAWARQVKGARGDRATSARALRSLRPFIRWLQQFEPATEEPVEAIFGAVPGRLTPHIYREDEVVRLLEAASRIGPPGSLRGAVMETLFGLIACTGLRISEALALRDADVDLKAGVLTVRKSKFGKSRLVPLHPTAVQALQCYRAQRDQHVARTSDTPLFIATRGRRLGEPLSERQAHRVFADLRRTLGWVGRGAHGAPRIHDLRHAFAVRRLLLWQQHGEDVERRMLALSTYLGHVKVSHTYWYITGVPELMELVGARFERFVDAWDGSDE